MTRASAIVRVVVGLAALGAAVPLVGCGGYPRTGPAPGPLSPTAIAAAQARWPDADAATLARGRELFLAKCDACHGYPALDAVDAGSWPSVMKRMAGNAHLPPADRDAVLHFILAAGDARE